MTQDWNPTPLLMASTLLICSFIGGPNMFWVAFVICSLLLVTRNYTISGKKQNTYFFFLVIHFAALIYQMTGHSLPMSGGDWGVFVRHAKNMILSADGILDYFNYFNNKLSGDFYERVCALIYHLFGYNQKYMYAVSFICGEVVYYGIYSISRLVTDDADSSILSSIFFYITPIEIVYSVDFLREMFAQALVITACYNFFVFFKHNSPMRFGIAFFFSFIASLVHSGYAGLVLAFIACFFLFDRKQVRLSMSIIRLLFVFIAIGIIYISPIWSFIATRFSGINSLEDLAEASSSQYASLGNTTYIGTPGNSIGVLLQTPIRLFYFLVSPLPWQVRSISTVLAMLLDSTIRWVLFYRIGKMIINHMYQKLIGKENVLLLYASFIIIIIVTLIFSWGTSNYGTAMRHRTTLYPLELVISFTFWHLADEKKKTQNADFYRSRYIKNK